MSCIHSIEPVDECPFCNGNWDRDLELIVKWLGVTMEQYDEAGDAVDGLASRDFDVVVPSEWEYIMIATQDIEPADLHSLCTVAAKISRTLSHTIWMYMNLWSEKFSSDMDIYVSPKLLEMLLKAVSDWGVK